MTNLETQILEFSPCHLLARCGINVHKAVLGKLVVLGEAVREYAFGRQRNILVRGFIDVRHGAIVDVVYEGGM